MYMYSRIASLLTFAIMLISSTSHSSLLNSLAPPNVASSLLENAVYIADGKSGLRIIDISDPHYPREVGFYDTPGNAEDVQVLGLYAYVADGDRGLRVIDISNPNTPKEVGSYDTPGNARAIAIVGNYTYLADETGGLRIIDVTSPTAPKEVGSYIPPGYYGEETDSVYDVFVLGSYAYLASTVLRIVDISQQKNPIEISTLFTGILSGVFVSGQYAYIADPFDAASGLVVVDVSNPRIPRQIAFIELASSAVEVFVEGSHAFLADWGVGFQVADTSNPKVPSHIGTYRSDSPHAHGIAVSGNLAFVTLEDGGLHIVDVSDPKYPSKVSSYDTPGTAQGIFVSRNKRRPVILVPAMLTSMNVPCFFSDTLSIVSCTNDSLWHWVPFIEAYYKPLINHLEAAGYTESNGLLNVFFYDWRQPIQSNVARLKSRVETVKSRNGVQKVDIIAHSMGGLVTRAYIQGSTYGDDVEHVVTLGTPNNGSAKSYPIWEGAYFYDMSFVEKIVYSSLMAYYMKKDSNIVPVYSIRNRFPGIKDLLPTSDYLYNSFSDSPISEGTYRQRNTTMAYLNSNIATLYARTKVATFAGTNEGTLSRFLVRPRALLEFFNWEDGEPVWDREAEFKSNEGDGTVLTNSALLPSAQTGIFSNVVHATLPGDTKVITDVFSFLDIPIRATPSSPIQESVIVMYLTGPVQVTVTDPQGRSVGSSRTSGSPTEKVANTIPNAEYITVPGEEFALIFIPNPSEGRYQILVSGTATNEYELGLLDTSSAAPKSLPDIMRLWDRSHTQTEVSAKTRYSFQFVTRNNVTPILIAQDPVIQLPVMAGENRVSGRALPGNTIEIFDTRTNTRLGTGVVHADGAFDVLLNSRLQLHQKIYPQVNGVIGLSITVRGHDIYLPMIRR